MSNLKAGFARVDITPPLGITLSGYYRVRHAEGILDPLYVTAVAFEDGVRKAVICSIDNIGFTQALMDRVRAYTAERVGTEKEAIFLACTHTHLGPCTANSEDKWENPDYIEFMTGKIADAAVMALEDAVPARMLYTRGRAEDVAFVRRFRMKDGSVQTNPGVSNPQILHALGEPDENSSLLIIKREGKPEIGIVNFQVHPDVISGSRISADYPKFVRDTYEKIIDNSRCMYINGTQGDTNHTDVRLRPGDLIKGYTRAQYMGKKIALSVIANYELAKELTGDKVAYGQKNILVKYNKGKPEELEEAVRINEIYQKGGEPAVGEATGTTGMKTTEITAKASRILTLQDKPDEKELYLTAVAVGDVVFVGFPGEPFTEVGRTVKANSGYTLTITACCANGYEGYYPVQSAFEEGGYEAATARYQAGTAEKIMEASTELVKEL